MTRQFAMEDASMAFAPTASARNDRDQPDAVHTGRPWWEPHPARPRNDQPYGPAEVAAAVAFGER